MTVIIRISQHPLNKHEGKSISPTTPCPNLNPADTYVFYKRQICRANPRRAPKLKTGKQKNHFVYITNLRACANVYAKNLPVKTKWFGTLLRAVGLFWSWPVGFKSKMHNGKYNRGRTASNEQITLVKLSTQWDRKVPGHEQSTLCKRTELNLLQLYRSS